MTGRIRWQSGMLRIALGTGVALGAGVAPGIIAAASAFTPPAPIAFDGGPLGTLQLSGGADGYAAALTGAGSGASPGLLGTDRSAGVEFLNGLIEVQKSTGLVQFTVQAGSTGTLTLGTRPTQTSVQTVSTGPLYTGYLTLAPSSHFSVSAGQLPSLEGYESAIDWNNSNLLMTDIFYVENTQNVGVTANATFGPVAANLTFGDGFDTNVWNFLQASATYTINSSNAVTVFGATNLGQTGLRAHIYGSASLPYSQSTVGAYGANYVNSSMIGAYYSFTWGNLNLVPEVQYVWAKPNAALVTPGSASMTGFSSNFGAALFADYQFGKSPYSLGAWVQYFSSNGPDTWFLNPGAQGVGVSIAPTWQYKHLFVRGDLGVIHLTALGTPGSVGYGSGGTGRNQATFLVETGVLF